MHHSGDYICCFYQPLESSSRTKCFPSRSMTACVLVYAIFYFIFSFIYLSLYLCGVKNSCWTAGRFKYRWKKTIMIPVNALHSCRSYTSLAKVFGVLVDCVHICGCMSLNSQPTYQRGIQSHTQHKVHPWNRKPHNYVLLIFKEQYLERC